MSARLIVKKEGEMVSKVGLPIGKVVTLGRNEQVCALSLSLSPSHSLLARSLARSLSRSLSLSFLRRWGCLAF